MEQQQENVPVPAAAAKPEKKARSKPVVAKKKPYKKMVLDALTNMKDRKGSSRSAIASHVAKENSIETNKQFNRLVSGAIRGMVEKKELLQASGSTMTDGRFKINKESAKAAEKAKGAAVKRKSAAKKKATPKKKPATKRKVSTARRARKSPVKKNKAKKAVKKTKAVRRKSPKKTVRKAKPKKAARSRK